MAAQEMKNMMAPAPSRKQAKTRRPRRCLNTGFGLCAAPFENVMVDATLAQPAPHLFGLSTRFRPQAMIDGKCRNPALAPLCPGGGKQTKRHAVSATGDRKSEMGRRLKRPRWRHQLSKFSLTERLALRSA